MMRLPLFHYYAPESVDEVVRILDGEENAMIMAGGTDLLPNMKRRQQQPRSVVGLRRVAALKNTRFNAAASPGGASLGAGLTITEIVEHPEVRSRYPALWQAASLIATPQIRNMGTLGGNLCLDTRCNYYDQNYEWRKAIDFCMKKDGNICWVATGSPKCLAVSSTDTAPALIALGASVRLVSQSSERQVALKDLYRKDGIDYLSRRPGELLTEVLLEPSIGWQSTYWKLRRRGSFDFPVLSVGAAAKIVGGIVENARIIVGSAASCPLEARDAQSFLRGKNLSDEVIEAAAAQTARLAKPLDNTDFDMGWRKKFTQKLATHALQELRGDDVQRARTRLA